MWVEVGLWWLLCCHCKTWLNFLEWRAHPVGYSISQKLFCWYFLHPQTLPNLCNQIWVCPGQLLPAPWLCWAGICEPAL